MRRRCAVTRVRSSRAPASSRALLALVVGVSRRSRRPQHLRFPGRRRPARGRARGSWTSLSSSPAQRPDRAPPPRYAALAARPAPGHRRAARPTSTLRAISVARIERALAPRRRQPGSLPTRTYRSTPRVLQHATRPARRAVDRDLGAREPGQARRPGSCPDRDRDNRAAVGLDRWLAYSRYVVGRFDSARRVRGPDHPEQRLHRAARGDLPRRTPATAAGGAPSSVARRWHWGPGEEGSLVLSKTAPLFTGLAFRTRLDDAAARRDRAVRARSSRPRASSSPRTASSGSRSTRCASGVTEAARYRWPGWKPLYCHRRDPLRARAAARASRASPTRCARSATTSSRVRRRLAHRRGHARLRRDPDRRPPRAQRQRCRTSSPSSSAGRASARSADSAPDLGRRVHARSPASSTRRSSAATTRAGSAARASRPAPTRAGCGCAAAGIPNPTGSSACA